MSMPWVGGGSYYGMVFRIRRWIIVHKFETRTAKENAWFLLFSCVCDFVASMGVTGSILFFDPCCGPDVTYSLDGRLCSLLYVPDGVSSQW
jgi:hypothetical protein